jgi:hypothetical protein
MLKENTTTQINAAVSRLDAWLETMRGPSGYGGPVAHWWQQSLMYAGTGLDWRYEGIITGYLQLWERTNDASWLIKACRAGDDLLHGQQEDSHFTASAFEFNPATAGTPHEAACDIGLLRLALALRKAEDADWEKYAQCAERNLQAFYIEKLWDSTVRSFRDHPHVPSFVPNKAATGCEAFFLLTDVTKNTLWVERYAIPTLDRILAHQVRGQGPLDGAIAQNSFGDRKVEKYFPVYIARCIPALLHGFIWLNQEKYADSALRAMQFIARWVSDDGSFPTVIYDNRRVNWYPSWIAALGDILRAAKEMRPYGFDADLSSVEHRLLAGQDASGGIQTATGFAAQASGKYESILDLRDILHVAGWCDKAFRYLTSTVGPGLPECQSSEFEAPCIFRGQQLYLVETPEMLEVYRDHEACYRWRKGERWPEVASEELWLH